MNSEVFFTILGLVIFLKVLFKSSNKVNYYLPLMKSSEAFRIIKRAGWYVVSQKVSHIKLAHNEYDHTIVFPYHGSKEIAKGLQRQLFKEARIDV